MSSRAPARDLLLESEPSRMGYNLTLLENPGISYSLAQSQTYCESLAKSHYENFTVGSLFVPKSVRQHLYNIYAYCRISDDLGDELGSPEESLRQLSIWEEELDACYEGHVSHPVFIALQKTIEKFNIPKEPFWRLIQAFKADQTKTRYTTHEEVLSYCVNSANPVGHLVLYVFGYSDRNRQLLSDYICTALQLANFWQDVARDFKIGRIYIPLEDMSRFGVTETHLVRNQATPEFKNLLKFEVDRTRALFEKGKPLLNEVNGLFRIDLNAFIEGGVAVLDGIEKIDYDVLSKRPQVSRFKKLGILLGALRQWAKHSV